METTIVKYVARDKDGSLHVFDKKPTRGDCYWFLYEPDSCKRIDENLFPELNWEDRYVLSVKIKADGEFEPIKKVFLREFE